MICVFKIPGWEKYNPRADVKSCSWFRMSNDFFNDPEFYGVSIEARVVWIYLLSVASKKMSPEVKINLDMMTDGLKITLDRLRNALDCLLQTGSLLAVEGYEISTRSNPIVLPMLPSATNERTDERTVNPPGAPSVFDPTSWLGAKKLTTESTPEIIEAEVVNTDLFTGDRLDTIEEVEAPQDAITILTMLNSICFRNFRPTKANVKFATARLKEGYALEDFKKVFTFKQAEWDGTEFAKYLRPSTVLGTKFDEYLSQAENADKGQPDADEKLVMSFVHSFGGGAA